MYGNLVYNSYIGGISADQLNEATVQLPSQFCLSMGGAVLSLDGRGCILLCISAVALTNVCDPYASLRNLVFFLVQHAPIKSQHED